MQIHSKSSSRASGKHRARVVGEAVLVRECVEHRFEDLVSFEMQLRAVIYRFGVVVASK